MSLAEFEKRYDCRLRPKSAVSFFRFIGWLFPRFNLYWTVYRVPFGKPTITYPDDVTNPTRVHYVTGVIQHELFHVEQVRSTWGMIWSYLLCLLLPLPCFFSGRWFLERDPYLNDIKKRLCKVSMGNTCDPALTKAYIKQNKEAEVLRVVYILWFNYGYVWPPTSMKEWFLEKLDDEITEQTNEQDP